MNDLKDTINEIPKLKYIKKSTIEYIKNNLEKVKECATTKENNCIDNMLTIISNPILKIDDKNNLIKLTNPIINAINKYQEEYEDENNEDEVDNNLLIEEVEELLDGKIHKYNKFNENHPMEGVSWNKSKELWRFNNEKYDKTSKKLDIIIIYAKEELFPIKKEKILKIWDKLKFIYSNHYFISYWHNNEPFFDIQHIISILNLKQSYVKEKYNEFSDKIQFYHWHKNKFDGYILRELISEKTMYKIILSSNSTFSKKFKDDVSDILIKLRKENKLEITNNKISLKSSKKIINNDLNNSMILKTPYESKLCTYDSFEDVNYVQHLLHIGANTPLSKYINKNVLYAFILTLKLNHDNIIIKFGFTDDIITRFKTLTQEYGCEIFFVGAKLINVPKDERKFHDIIKQKYPYCIQPYSINGKDKNELYKLTSCLITEFDNYNLIEEEEECDKIKYSKEEKEVIDYIQQQVSIFLNYISTCNYDNNKLRFDYLITKENSLIRDKDILLSKLKYDNIDKDKDIILANINKEKDITLAKLKYDNIEKEIELIKAQTELEKVKKNYFQDNSNILLSDNNNISQINKKQKK